MTSRLIALGLLVLTMLLSVVDNSRKQKQQSITDGPDPATSEFCKTTPLGLLICSVTNNPVVDDPDPGQQ